jgi:hypothetical protein
MSSNNEAAVVLLDMFPPRLGDTRLASEILDITLARASPEYPQYQRLAIDIIIPKRKARGIVNKVLGGSYCRCDFPNSGPFG